MSNQAIIRTQSTDISGSQYLNTPHSLLMPQAPVLNKSFVREYINYVPDNGTNQAQPGVTITFTQRRDYDVLNQWYLRFIATGLTAPVAPITFSRWVDRLGPASVEEIRVQSGTQQLQVIRGLELVVYALKCLDIDQQQGVELMWLGGTPAFRSLESLADREIICPLLTCIGLGMFGDLCQGLYVRGLNDLLTLRWQIPAASTLIESDGAIQATPAAGFFQQGSLFTEGSHLNRAERRDIATFYKMRPFSLTFDDQQYTTEEIVLGTQTLPFAQNFLMSGVNQPVSVLAIIPRWDDDMSRVTNGANGSRGRNRWNWGGVILPGGAGVSNGIMQDIRIRTGNNDIIATIPVDRLLNFQHTRDFKGPAGAGPPAYSFSRDFSMKNAVMGFVGFDQIEQPQVTINWRVPTRGTAFASFNAAATAELGNNSALRVQILAFTKNQIDQASFLLSKPFG